ncbi:MAG: ROK family protein, partial [Candidatus Omnitrophica bacterium]|nr:ROK family protein [Candidatus Omnitrophota bacterium]
KKDRNKVEGVGVALGGVIHHQKGVVYWPQREDSSAIYIALPLKEYLEEKFHLPIILENDTNACAWAEYASNFSSQEHLLYFFSGIGSGLVLNGQLYRGRDGGAGELFLHPKKKMHSLLGDFSFLRQWSVDLGMVDRAKEGISLGRTTGLLKRVSSTGELKMRDIFAEAAGQDEFAREVLSEGAYCLGVKAAFMINLLNPETVVLGGGVEEAPEYFLHECVNTVKKFSFSESRKGVSIVYSDLGKRAASLGGALLFFKKKLYRDT